MFILYFDNTYFEYYHLVIYDKWTDYPHLRPGESFWLIPSTDPEDATYG